MPEVVSPAHSQFGVQARLVVLVLSGTQHTTGITQGVSNGKPTTTTYWVCVGLTATPGIVIGGGGVETGVGVPRTLDVWGTGASGGTCSSGTQHTTGITQGVSNGRPTTTTYWVCVGSTATPGLVTGGGGVETGVGVPRTLDVWGTGVSGGTCSSGTQHTTGITQGVSNGRPTTTTYWFCVS